MTQIYSDRIPLSFQVFQVLRERIERGDLASGHRLPTEVALAKDFGVSVVTIQRALKDLSSAGLITRHRRRGTFVRNDRAQVQPKQSDALSLMFSDEFSSDTQILTKGLVERPDRLARIFPKERRLLYIERLVFRSGIPWSYAQIYVTPNLASRITTPMLKRYPLFRLLREKLKLTLDKVTVNLQAKPAGMQVGTALQLDPLAPVTVMNATLFDPKKNAVNWLEIYYRGDSFAFRFEMNLRTHEKSMQTK